MRNIHNQIQVDLEEILHKVDLSGTTDWYPDEPWDAHNLKCKYACIISQNDLDLGKTSIVKHSMMLTDHQKMLPAHSSRNV